MRRLFKIKKSALLCFFGLSLILIKFYPAFAYMMGSDNYRIQSDSVNIGGQGQSSETYFSEDTMGEIATGISDSENYGMKAGYQQMQEVFISLSPPSNIAMNAMGISQDTSIGTGDAWTVVTDAPGGYILTFQTDSVNALADGGAGEAFADYTEATSGVPETWSVGSGAYEFGFSVFGDDANTATWGTDSTCGSGSSPSVNLKYEGLKSVTAITVADSDSRTSPSGTDTVLCVAAEQNNIYAPSGSYVADITATAISQ